MAVLLCVSLCYGMYVGGWVLCYCRSVLIDLSHLSSKDSLIKSILICNNEHCLYSPPSYKWPVLTDFPHLSSKDWVKSISELFKLSPKDMGLYDGVESYGIGLDKYCIWCLYVCVWLRSVAGVILLERDSTVWDFPSDTFPRFSECILSRFFPTWLECFFPRFFFLYRYHLLRRLARVSRCNATVCGYMCHMCGRGEAYV